MRIGQKNVQISLVFGSMEELGILLLRFTDLYLFQAGKVVWEISTSTIWTPCLVFRHSYLFSDNVLHFFEQNPKIRFLF